MNPLRVKALVLLMLMLAAFAGAAAWKPKLHMADTRENMELEKIFPRQFEDWVIDDRLPIQLVSPDTVAMLKKIYNQTLSRTYVNAAGDRVMLSVAYGGDQSDATRAHRPEVCYPAQGFQIISESKAMLPVLGRELPIRRLVARLGGRIEPISYWVMVGNRPVTSGTGQKFAQLEYSTRGVIPDGMLVRVSTIDARTERSFAVHAVFIDALAHALDAAVAPRVIGLQTSAPQ
jgi:EpsI family protein